MFLVSNFVYKCWNRCCVRMDASRECVYPSVRVLVECEKMLFLLSACFLIGIGLHFQNPPCPLPTSPLAASFPSSFCCQPLIPPPLPFLHPHHLPPLPPPLLFPPLHHLPPLRPLPPPLDLQPSILPRPRPIGLGLLSPVDCQPFSLKSLQVPLFQTEISAAACTRPTSLHLQSLPVPVFQPQISATTRPTSLHLQTYSRQQLLSWQPPPSSTLSPSLISNLKSLGIATNLPTVRRRRGCRGGKNKQRNIKVLCQLSTRNPVTAVQSHHCSQHNASTVNFSNLIPLSTKPSKLPCLQLAVYNARSVGPAFKRSAINFFIADNNIDIFCVTESWLKVAGDEAKCADLAPPGYRTISCPRSSHAGGVAFVVRESLHPLTTTTTVFPFDHPSFEILKLTVNLPQQCLQLVVLYRRPPKKANNLTDSQFYRELPLLLQYCNTMGGSPLIVGDFNVHVDNPSDYRTALLSSLFEDFGLVQSVTFPTHQKGHTLDLVLSRRDDRLLQSVHPDFTLDVSDHHCIVCTLHITRPTPAPVYVEARNFSNIDLASFKEDLQSRLPVSMQISADDLHCTLKELLDHHAPPSRRRISHRPPSPWFASVGPKLLEAKRERRRVERQYLKTGLTVFKEMFRVCNRVVNSLVHQAKTSYYNAKILSCATSRQLFNLTGTLLGKTKSSPLPTSFPSSDLPSQFSDFFSNKIKAIRQNLDSATTTSPSFPDPPYLGTVWSDFKLISQNDVRKIIKQSTIKSCDLDPLPASLLSYCLDDLLPHLTNVINESLQSGTFPSSYKKAIVKPLLKKPTLDPECLKNYRPVSNLSFFSKITEKVVLNQLSSHLLDNNLFYPLQSAYRAGHSTETALLKIVNDLLISLDQNKVSVLSLLDLSAAFDTIDHSILIQRLEHSFGISGTPLTWFKSYISDRTQCVSVNGSSSPPTLLQYGVPQGSVLGPLLFVLYTHPLSTIVQHHALSHHCFSDDNQLYKSVPVSQLGKAISSTKECITDIQAWMHSNKLQLNADKTEIILIRPKVNDKMVQYPSSLDLNGTSIVFSDSVRNLGAVLDQHLSFEQHVSRTCQTCYLELRRISSIKHYLSQNALKTLVCSLVLSRLDYCNSLLGGISKKLTKRLQMVQNHAARLISSTKRRDHISPVLKDLHWLPVDQRIVYKLLLLTHKCLNDQGPSYLSDLLKIYTPARHLRSSFDSRRLQIPSFRLKTVGYRSFSYQAALLWNSLPHSLRHSDSTPSFKRALKTHLFPKL